jgi:phosphomannomutase
MTRNPIKFGTDGWRGRIAENYTFEAVRRCSHGFAKYLLDVEGSEKPIVIGFDKRFASEAFAESAAEVLAGNGFRVLLTDGPTPTPTISYSVVHHGAIGAINITASHNPSADNGFKVRDQYGGAIDPKGLRIIEAGIPDDDLKIPRVNIHEALTSGAVERFDASPA